MVSGIQTDENQPIKLSECLYIIPIQDTTGSTDYYTEDILPNATIPQPQTIITKFPTESMVGFKNHREWWWYILKMDVYLTKLIQIDTRHMNQRTEIYGHTKSRGKLQEWLSTYYNTFG